MRIELLIKTEEDPFLSQTIPINNTIELDEKPGGGKVAC